MSISVDNVNKTYGSHRALQNVSLDVKSGELVALLGPSGSGKTTLLRIIAGLDIPDYSSQSRILFNGVDVFEQRVGQRQVGFVFQHYALFRHMTVFENIAFGLRVRPRRIRPSQSQIDARVRELLALIQLENFSNRYPHQLSGGQRQRVALARALAIEPKVLLLDEPFGALDAKVRQGLRNWLRRLHNELHITSILVTHDQEEALEVADRIVIMNEGRVEQVGTPTEVFHQPKTEFVIDFLGNVNVFHGRLEQGKAVVPGMTLEVPGVSSTASSNANIYIRPHELDMKRHANGASSLSARVTRINAVGSVAKVGLAANDGRELSVELPHDRFTYLAPQIGEQFYVTPRNIRVFSEDYMI